ncbi:ABC transporter permease [Pseudomonas sp. Z1-29]|uniref:ABC transporter permease n=1 Tax=Pseudomonas sp. Z1-29 TaxID=2817410 RepID=UPI003DA8295B
MTESTRYGPLPWQLLTEALDSLRRLGRRALLALLGIAVGCAAVVALLNIGHNAQARSMEVFQAMGSDLLIADVKPASNKGVPGHAPTNLDNQALREALPEVLAVSALNLASVPASMHGRPLSTLLAGVDPEIASVLGLQPEQGRFLSRYDAQSTHAVLGATLAAQHAPVAPGDTLQLAGYLFQVVGVLHSHGQNPLLPLPIDDSILVPIEGMRRLVFAPQIGTVLVRSNEGAGSQTLAPKLHDYLLTSLPGREIDVQVPQRLLDGLAQQSQLFSWLLAGLGGISLLVGGVGVMNIMLMNVAERRGEIGVRMALGARPRDIAWLFLLEAMVLTVAGASTGALLGVATGWLFVVLSGWMDFTLSPLSLPLGMGGALLTGLLFGLSPALSAARLQPVQALRDD